jgi:hypothetical protein
MGITEGLHRRRVESLNSAMPIAFAMPITAVIFVANAIRL